MCILPFISVYTIIVPSVRYIAKSPLNLDFLPRSLGYFFAFLYILLNDTYHVAWITYCNSVIGNIFCYDAACTYYYISAYINTWAYNASPTNPSIISNSNRISHLNTCNTRCCLYRMCCRINLYVWCKHYIISNSHCINI